MKVVITTPRLIVREYLEDDLQLRQLFGADEDVTRFTPKRTPQEIDALFRDNLQLYKNGEGLGRWAIIDAETKEYMGDCMLLTAREGLTGVELGYAFHKKHWGKGLATELVAELVRHGFEDLQLNRICAITIMENVASQKVLLNNGFQQVENAKIKDTELYQYVKHKGD
ncbi:GNAT family N-acetyltransferase [Mucilaginibacter sp. KACC 22063]|uniref:GNAT family N-acetyltransferase n=1 Tax=Mucilaginibacter sp. KACC 22063 TaxID=3025666 RepID=UPI0023667C1D|nr:GNAT family N-acetyltransferase [Mucilaginibacter sp. KACC 22063]WDF55500.1 GNAT family N-acetyltransferase [Mucilaginibacter sp. KACC 22063]